jgi:hypothetical protein
MVSSSEVEQEEGFPGGIARARLERPGPSRQVVDHDPAASRRYVDILYSTEKSDKID